VTIIMRSALVHWGHNPPADLALIEEDYRGRRIITWEDVMRERRERQRRELANRRCVVGDGIWRAARVLVAYFDQNLMGGWQAFIDDLNGQHWIDRDQQHLIPKLVSSFPLTGQLFPMKDKWGGSWGEWKIAFAKQYQRGKQAGKPRGSNAVWWNNRDIIVPPNKPWSRLNGSVVPDSLMGEALPSAGGAI
jgi:hypothetical protein